MWGGVGQQLNFSQHLNRFLKKYLEWSETQNKHIKSITKFFIKQTLREGGWIGKFLSVGDT